MQPHVSIALLRRFLTALYQNQKPYVHAPFAFQLCFRASPEFIAQPLFIPRP